MQPTKSTVLTVDKTADHEFLHRYGGIYVPITATQIKMGPAGHRCQAATSNHQKKNFTWIGISDDIKTFVRKGLHCHSTKWKFRVTREQAYTLHVRKPNKFLHFDYLSISEIEQDYNYIFICRDDISSFVWLVKTCTYDTESAVVALQNWIINFGAPKIWILDQGSYFKKTSWKILQLRSAQNTTLLRITTPRVTVP